MGIEQAASAACPDRQVGQYTSNVMPRNPSPTSQSPRTCFLPEEASATQFPATQLDTQPSPPPTTTHEDASPDLPLIPPDSPVSGSAGGTREEDDIPTTLQARQRRWGSEERVQDALAAPTGRSFARAVYQNSMATHGRDIYGSAGIMSEQERLQVGITATQNPIQLKPNPTQLPIAAETLPAPAESHPAPDSGRPRKGNTWPFLHLVRGSTPPPAGTPPVAGESTEPDHETANPAARPQPEGHASRPAGGRHSRSGGTISSLSDHIAGWTRLCIHAHISGATCQYIHHHRARI